MMPTRDETWLHSLIESIDHRLELLNTKVDIAIGNMTTKAYCADECGVRKNAIDKRYFLGWGSAIVVVVAVVGLAIKFA